MDAPPPPPPQSTTQPAPRRAPHPMQILEDHEIRLRNIEAAQRESQGADGGAVTSSVDEGLLQSLVNRIAALESGSATSGGGSEESQDIKTQLLKLQTFAIETNTFVMKLQKELEQLTSGTQSAFERLSALESSNNDVEGEEEDTSDQNTDIAVSGADSEGAEN